MKKIILGIILTLFFAGSANAGCEILIPKSKCDQIVGGSYSTGGGDQVIQYAKIFCTMKDGSGWIHMPEKMSKAGMAGKVFGSRTVGRMFSADECKLTITDKVDEAEFD